MFWQQFQHRINDKKGGWLFCGFVVQCVTGLGWFRLGLNWTVPNITINTTIMNKKIPKTSYSLINKLSINEFELVSLLCKRMKELTLGAKPQINDKYGSLLETAIAEILSDKLQLQVTE